MIRDVFEVVCELCKKNVTVAHLLLSTESLLSVFRLFCLKLLILFSVYCIIWQFLKTRLAIIVVSVLLFACVAVKEECMSDEDDRSRDALVEEMLQQGDTAVIFPEPPDDEPRQGTPETSGHDENGTHNCVPYELLIPLLNTVGKREHGFTIKNF